MSAFENSWEALDKARNPANYETVTTAEGKEVTFLKVLKGPTIIKFHENFSHKNSIFIVMEYCSKGNLD